MNEQLSIEEALRKGIEAYKAGNAKKADTYYTAILKAQPDHPDANHNMGVLAVSLGHSKKALPFLETALIVSPNNLQFNVSYIDALIRLGQLGEAKKMLSKVDKMGVRRRIFDELKARLQSSGENSDTVVSTPDEAEDPPNDKLQRLYTLYKQQKLEQALYEASKLLEKFTYSVALYNFCGATNRGLGKFNAAISAYEKALEINPNLHQIHFNIGIVYFDQGNFEMAIGSYKKALSIQPDFADAHINMANALKEQQKFDEAVEGYKKTLVLKPNYAEAFYNMGNTLKIQGKLDGALKAFRQAIELKPNLAVAYNNMGNVLKEIGKLDEALKAYEKAYEIQPNYYAAYGAAKHVKAQICAWEGSDDTILKNYILENQSKNVQYPMLPFQFLHSVHSQDVQYRLTKIYVENTFKKKTEAHVFAKPGSKPNRLRVGYFSPDFRDHPVAQMIEGPLRYHNHNNFEIFAYSFCKKVDEEFFKKVKKAAHNFRDVESNSIAETTLLARKDQLHIAVDLTGYTQKGRSEIFHHRVAPVQINYLGYPGTMATDCIDYVIADKTLIPVEKEGFYKEKIIFMPDCYQPTNDNLIVSNSGLTKEDLGLPPDAFVFCAINQGYKIKAQEFDIWMRLLRHVNGSVLWLKNQNKWMVSNLQAEAKIRGIDPKRLIFTKHVPHDKYIAQFTQADLYLDTFIYNAGTTASDVLMAGLPLVTKIGDGYSSRMAASLLNACNMNELVTETPKDYESLALELAMNPKKLNKVKERMHKNIKCSSIFDTKLYTTYLEAGYEQAYDIFYSGKNPKNIDLKGRALVSDMDGSL